jgi:transposase
LIGGVVWGYNRDREKLSQVNLCMPLGEQSRPPVFRTLYNGSIKDVNILKTTLSLTFHIQGNRLILVMELNLTRKYE